MTPVRGWGPAFLFRPKFLKKAVAFAPSWRTFINPLAGKYDAQFDTVSLPLCTRALGPALVAGLAVSALGKSNRQLLALSIAREVFKSLVGFSCGRQRIDGLIDLVGYGRSIFRAQAKLQTHLVYRPQVGDA